MFNPDLNPGVAGPVYFMPSFEAAARSLKVEAIAAPVHDEVEIETDGLSGLNSGAHDPSLT
jgi:hypothetical protein